MPDEPIGVTTTVPAGVDPVTVCQGGLGRLGVTNASSPNATWGSGSDAAYDAATGQSVGKGGDGFLVLRVRADQANVVMA